MNKFSATAKLLFLISVAGTGVAGYAAEDQEYSLSDLIQIINKANEDLPKTIDDQIVIERIVQGAGRQMIYIYTVPVKDGDLSDKQRKSIGQGIQKNLCAGSQMFVKDGISVSARLFSTDRHQIIAVTANKASCGSK
jgi:hypothetical protein